jgi:hypothetical protein
MLHDPPILPRSGSGGNDTLQAPQQPRHLNITSAANIVGTEYTGV